MKRSLLVLTAAAVVLTPLAATAAPAKATKRVVTFTYSGFSSADTPAVSFHFSGVCAAANSCMEFPTSKGEKTIEIKASSANVGIQIWADDSYATASESFCGSGKISVSPKTAHFISVRPSLGACGGVPTSGTLTATILGTK